MAAITLLDGGIGQEITHRSGDRPTPLWSTQVMIDHPGLVQGVHRDYFNAGATIATTNSYAIHRDRLVPAGIENRLLDLLAKSCAEASAARDDFGSGRIAGAIGPLHASYRADVVPEPEIAAPLIAEVAVELAKHCDLLIVETVSSLKAAEGCMQGCAGLDLPVWLAVSVTEADGTRLRSGEAVGELAEVVGRYPPDAVLVNCSTPEAISDTLPLLREFGLPFGAYANGFTRISEGFLKDRPTVDALTARSDLGPDAYAEFAMNWVGMGATIIGGCCETTPEHIAEIARRLQQEGYEIV